MSLHSISNQNPVLIVCALKAEAAGIIRAYSLEKDNQSAFPLFRSDSVCCVITGIGTVSVMRILPLAIEITSPGRVINAGSAGALSPSVKRNTVYEISRVSMHNPGGPAHADIIIKTAGIFPDTSLLTSLKPVIDDTERNTLRAKADLVDMEGYATASITQERDIPLSLIKIVSDSYSDLDELAVRRLIVQSGETLADHVVRFIAGN